MPDVHSPPPLNDSTPPPPRLAMDLVDVDKRVLRFPVNSQPSGAIISETLTVTNAATTHVAFKVKTTNQHRYIVRPNLGLIPPRGSSEIFIALQPTRFEAPELGMSRDKFLLRVIEAPELADSKLPNDFWIVHEKDVAVRDVKFKVEFVHPSPVSQPSHPSPQLNEVSASLSATNPVTLATSAAPHPRDLPPSTNSESVLPSGSQREAIASSSTQPPTKDGVQQLMEGRDFDAAIERVRQLQQLLDAKNLELARLKTQLAETNAQTQAVLDNAPKAPISANKLLSDPFGGVSIAGIGLMLLLFLILVNVILRIL
ncbi:vesicle-associated protein 1-2 [Gracilaria domingensis]|nr:vesicle-associated protein 1-2 [Gracilaria domingensis]